jgi:hypothetical protein
VFGKIARPADGLKDGAEPPQRTPGAGLYSRARACGGTGRRARLRALWTIWSVEVRILSGALRKPRSGRGFLVLEAGASGVRCDNSVTTLGEARTGDRKQRKYPGIHSYEVAGETRYRAAYRDSNGRQLTKRGFPSPRAAATWRGEQVVKASKGELHSTRQTFASFFDEWLADRRPYTAPGTWSDYRYHGELRLNRGGRLAFAARPDPGLTRQAAWCTGVGAATRSGPRATGWRCRNARSWAQLAAASLPAAPGRRAAAAPGARGRTGRRGAGASRRARGRR